MSEAPERKNRENFHWNTRKDSTESLETTEVRKHQTSQNICQQQLGSSKQQKTA